MQLGGDELWNCIGVEVDEQLKRILKATKFDKLSLLASLSETDRKHMETFMKERLHKIIPPAHREKYYGIYEFNPMEFQFEAGDIKTLELVQKACKKHLLCQSSSQNKEVCMLR